MPHRSARPPGVMMTCAGVPRPSKAAVPFRVMRNASVPCTMEAAAISPAGPDSHTLSDAGVVTASVRPTSMTPAVALYEADDMPGDTVSG